MDQFSGRNHTSDVTDLPIPAMNHHFKFPLKVSGIAFLIALVIVIAGSTWIYQQKISDRQKQERAAMFGSGLGMFTSLVIAPFWLIAAGKIGKERRAARDAKTQKPS